MKILIVDDNPTSLKLLQAQLEAEGYQVFSPAALVRKVREQLNAARFPHLR